jgi:predicted nucleotidyltransferase
METTLTATEPASSPIPEIISEEFLELLRAHRVTRAYLFGSVVNGGFGPESDLDLLVTFDRPVTMFDQLRLAERLRHVCGRPVDLMSEIHPAFVPSILPTLVHLSLS